MSEMRTRFRQKVINLKLFPTINEEFEDLVLNATEGNKPMTNTALRSGIHFKMIEENILRSQTLSPLVFTPVLKYPYEAPDTRMKL